MEAVAVQKEHTHAAKSPKACAVRRKKLVRALIDGKSLRETAISTGLSPATAQKQATQILDHPTSKALFAEYLEKAGLSDEILAEKIEKLTNADQTLFFQHQGRVTDERIVPALETRRKSLELCARLKGHLQETKVSPDITINIMGAVINALKGDQD